MSDGKKKNKPKNKSLLDYLLGTEPEEEKPPSEEKKIDEWEPRPSLDTIGLTDCSVCSHEVGVVLTRTKHPFTACGRCGARTFYNSKIAILILKDRLRKIRL